MKTKTDHLLACVGEECGEVQQIVGKALRFGIADTNPQTGNTNFYELTKELNDLIAAYEMLCKQVNEKPDICRTAIKNKKKRVAHYMEHAVAVGELDKGL